MVFGVAFTSPQILQVHYVHTSTDLDLGEVQESLLISSACLDKNASAMFGLIRQFMSETNWDNEKKLENLIKNSASGVVNSVASGGSRFAELYASSKLTPAKVRSKNDIPKS